MKRIIVLMLVLLVIVGSSGCIMNKNTTNNTNQNNNMSQQNNPQHNNSTLQNTTEYNFMNVITNTSITLSIDTHQTINLKIVPDGNIIVKDSDGNIIKDYSNIVINPPEKMIRILLNDSKEVHVKIFINNKQVKEYILKPEVYNNLNGKLTIDMTENKITLTVYKNNEELFTFVPGNDLVKLNKNEIVINSIDELKGNIEILKFSSKFPKIMITTDPKTNLVTITTLSPVKIVSVDGIYFNKSRTTIIFDYGDITLKYNNNIIKIKNINPVSFIPKFIVRYNSTNYDVTEFLTSPSFGVDITISDSSNYDVLIEKIKGNFYKVSVNNKGYLIRLGYSFTPTHYVLVSNKDIVLWWDGKSEISKSPIVFSQTLLKKLSSIVPTNNTPQNTTNNSSNSNGETHFSKINKNVVIEHYVLDNGANTFTTNSLIFTNITVTKGDNVEVTINNEEYTPTINKDGYIVIYNLPDGTYDIKVRVNGVTEFNNRVIVKTNLNKIIKKETSKIDLINNLVNITYSTTSNLTILNLFNKYMGFAFFTERHNKNFKLDFPVYTSLLNAREDYEPVYRPEFYRKYYVLLNSNDYFSFMIMDNGSTSIGITNKIFHDFNMIPNDKLSTFIQTLEYLNIYKPYTSGVVYGVYVNRWGTDEFYKYIFDRSFIYGKITPRNFSIRVSDITNNKVTYVLVSQSSPISPVTDIIDDFKNEKTKVETIPDYKYELDLTNNIITRLTNKLTKITSGYHLSDYYGYSYDTSTTSNGDTLFNITLKHDENNHTIINVPNNFYIVTYGNINISYIITNGSIKDVTPEGYWFKIYKINSKNITISSNIPDKVKMDTYLMYSPTEDFLNINNILIPLDMILS